MRVQRKYWITKMRFCITFSNVRWTLFLSLVKWRKIHSQLHWALVRVSQNAHWYLQKFLKCSHLKACCSCQPAPASPLTRAGEARRCWKGSWKPLPSSPRCHRGSWGHSPQLCVPEGSVGVEQAPKNVSPLPRLCPYWCTWFGAVLNSFVLKQDRGHKRQAGPWRETMGLGQANWGCGSTLLFWEDGSRGGRCDGCVWSRGQAAHCVPVAQEYSLGQNVAQPTWPCPSCVLHPCSW